MSVAKNIKNQIKNIPLSEPFTSSKFLTFGTRASVDKTMSRLVKEGFIERVARGVFYRPKKSHFIGKVVPELSSILAVIAQAHGETIQIHGAEAARQFKLSTQMPTTPVYYTNGTAREIIIGKLNVKLIHTSSQRKLQYAGKKLGMALSALWYIGKEQINNQVIHHIHERLSAQEFELLQSTSMPAWMRQAINNYNQEEMSA